MARITVEDCLKKVPNMYDLVLTAAQRARELQKGEESSIKTKNRLIVTALREIADGSVTGPDRPDDGDNLN